MLTWKEGTGGTEVVDEKALQMARRHKQTCALSPSGLEPRAQYGSHGIPTCPRVPRMVSRTQGNPRQVSPPRRSLGPWEERKRILMEREAGFRASCHPGWKRLSHGLSDPREQVRTWKRSPVRVDARNRETWENSMNGPERRAKLASVPVAPARPTQRRIPYS